MLKSRNVIGEFFPGDIRLAAQPGATLIFERLQIYGFVQSKVIVDKDTRVLHAYDNAAYHTTAESQSAISQGIVNEVCLAA